MTAFKGHSDGWIRKWNFKGECVIFFKAHETINGLVLTNHEVFTASYDGRAKKWTHDGKLLQTYEGYAGTVITATLWSGVIISADTTAYQWTGEGP